MRSVTPLPLGLMLACAPGAVLEDSSTGPTPTTPPLPAGCADLPDRASVEAQVDVQTEEDFDFDAHGQVVFQLGSAIVGQTLDGVQTVLGSSVTTDPSGIQVAPDGSVIVAGQDSASIVRLDVDTASVETLASNTQRPNGLEVGADGVIYVSEFLESHARIHWIDPAAGTSGVLAEGLQWPNGLALTPDEQALVVVAERPNTDPVLLQLHRQEDGWGSREGLYEPEEAKLDGVEIDACGNVYLLDYGTGELVRMGPDGSDPTVLLTLTDDHPSEHFSSLRWGSGVGGWRPSWLWVTDRAWLYGIDVGAPGRPGAAVAGR